MKAISNNREAILEKLADFANSGDAGTIETRALSIPYDLIISPNISIGIYLQEAYNLNYYAIEDREILCFRGLDWCLVDELPDRIELVRKWEAVWYATRYRETATQKELKALFALIDVSRNELLASMKYAFYGDALEQAVRYIRNGVEESDYAQDLSHIVGLAGAHLEKLQAVGCDMRHVELLKKHMDIYSDLLAKCNVEEMQKPLVRNDRDRTYTFLVIAVETIRRAARHAFWNDKKHLRGYASEYFRKSTRGEK